MFHQIRQIDIDPLMGLRQVKNASNLLGFCVNTKHTYIHITDIDSSFSYVYSFLPIFSSTLPSTPLHATCTHLPLNGLIFPIKIISLLRPLLLSGFVYVIHMGQLL
jgi:hypothetical protein